MQDSGTAAACDGALDTGRTIVRIGHQPVGERRFDQPIENFGLIKFATGDQLEQRERGAIERMIALAVRGACERCGLVFERGPAVGVRRSTVLQRHPHGRERALGNRWSLAREMQSARPARSRSGDHYPSDRPGRQGERSEALERSRHHHEHRNHRRRGPRLIGSDRLRGTTDEDRALVIEHQRRGDRSVPGFKLA